MSLIFYILGTVIIVLILASIRTVRPTNRGVIERLGKYNRFAEPGLHLVFPLVERMFTVNVTERMVEATPQEIITSDKLNAQVDAQIYFKVKSDETSVKASQYNVYNYEFQITNLARTTLRNIIGTMKLTEANSERGKINADLQKTLLTETAKWGIDVIRTELKEIDPPKDVQETMNKVVKAENEKVAAVDFATATETQADGKRRAAIKEAQGIKQNRILVAEGEAEAIKLINESAQKYFKGDAKELKRLEVIENSLKDNTKVILSESGINPTIILGNERVIPIRPKDGKRH